MWFSRKVQNIVLVRESNVDNKTLKILNAVVNTFFSFHRLFGTSKGSESIFRRPDESKTSFLQRFISIRLSGTITRSKSIFTKRGKSQTSSLRHFLSIRFANRFFTDNTPKVVERSPATLQYFCIFFLRLVMSRAAEPELGILPGTSAGAQIKNQKEPETKLKMRRSRSSV